MTIKCGFCEGEAGDNRECVLCNQPLCWSHVVRISIAVHRGDVCYEVPMYLCRECLRRNKDLMDGLQVKYFKTGYQVYKQIIDIIKK